MRDSHPHVDIDRLAIAIRSATGIETLIWLIDIAGYTRQQAATTVKATARALLDAAIRGCHPRRRPGRLTDAETTTQLTVVD